MHYTEHFYDFQHSGLMTIPIESFFVPNLISINLYDEVPFLLSGGLLIPFNAVADNSLVLLGEDVGIRGFIQQGFMSFFCVFT